MEPDTDPKLHRLEGSSGREKGGLIIKKKSQASEEAHVFKKPSLLGLDRLAAAKRLADKDEIVDKKRSKVSNYDDVQRRQSRVTSFKDEEDDSSSDESDKSDDENKQKDSSKSRKDRYF